MGVRPSVFTLISNHRPETVVSRTTSGAIANRSTKPVDQPLWLKSGVASGGRNVDIEARLTSRGNEMSPPPNVWRVETMVSIRVKVSKLFSWISGSPGRLFTGDATYRN